MADHDIVVIGAPAGVEVSARLVRSLPEDLPAAEFVVPHVPSSASSALPARRRPARRRQPG